MDSNIISRLDDIGIASHAMETFWEIAKYLFRKTDKIINKTKSVAVKEVMREISVNNGTNDSSQEIITNLQFRGERILLPEFITELFNNPVFRVFILFLVAYIANKNPAAALLMSIAFMVTMNVVNRQEVEESFLDIIDTFTGGETGAACDGVSIDSCKSKWTNFNQENADSECGDLHKCCDCLAPTKPELVPTMCQAKEGGGYRVSSSNGDQGVACAEH